MTQSKWRSFLTAALLTALLVTALAPVAFAAEQAAPAFQVRASEVSGMIPGGQFAKFWLGLIPDRPGTVTVTATWDRSNPEDNGVGFYVLNEAGLAAVVNGQRIEVNNVASGDTNFFLRGADNVQGASFRATGETYTIVVYNDSASDANFTLLVDNGVIVDESDQVTAAGAVAEETTPAAEETTEAVVEAPAAAATEAAAAVETPAATPAETTTTTVVASGPFRGSSVNGELGEQYEQHYLGLEPEQRDSDISLRLTFDPRDNQELARRLNFWVLDETGLRRYQAGENASDLAIANGNRVNTPGDENVRSASFTAPGLGSYTVIVYNNSRVPATYELVATGALLVDDSLQTISAQEAATTTTTTVAATAATGETGATTTTTTTVTTTEGAGRVGEPGGTYTVQSGDTLALIARDIYGDFRLYEQLCSFNTIADCNVIEIGQVLNLPTREQIGAGATAPAAAATTAATPAAVATTAATTETATTTATTTVTTTGTTTPTATTTTTGTATTAAGTIAEIAASNPNFSILAQALEATGLDATLGSGEFTVFAPTDAAFNELLSQTGLTAAQLLQAAELSQILQYHVVSGEVGSTDITNGMRATTVQGQPVTFELRDGSVYVNGAKVTIADIQASNGVIHAISAVILPPAQ
ncbi:MAG: fasciclin domain-containing protein [Caldilinea sp.]